MEDNSRNGDGRTTSALLRDSVKGTRSLAGSNVHVPVPEGPDDHLVTSLPLLKSEDFRGKHWAGLLPVNDKKDGYLFYWLFAPDEDALQKGKDKGIVKEDESNVPLVIWLNGGPACSSMDGLWIENGPFRLQPGTGSDWNNMKIFEHSWHKAPAYTLYIDQPVGTGLAFTTSRNYPNNDERVNEDFYYFMTEFMKLHATTLGVVPQQHQGNKKLTIPTLTRPFFFSGESHAGHYIPSMMNYIRKQNLHLSNLKQSGGVVMPLTGAAIGNGWFDPVYQYSAHEAAYGYGLIGKAQERGLALKEQKCRQDLAAKKYVSQTCFGLLSEVTGNSLGKDNPMTVSQYDTRVWEDRKKPRDFPRGHHNVEAYLGKSETITNANVFDVLKAVHAMPSWNSGQRYRECTDPPYNALAHQDGLGVVPDIVELLEHSDGEDEQPPITLLFFNGVHDLICNHAGNENALEHLPWKHRTDYIQAMRYGWKAPSTGKLGGYAKEYQNLIFLKVLDAGHMVPMDVPEVALDMMVTFLYSTKKGTFDTYKQSIAPTVEDASGSSSSNNKENCPACPTCPKPPTPSKSNNSQDCPVCDDTAKCTKQQCQKKYPVDDGDVTTKTEMLGLDSAVLSGIFWGASTFSVLAVLSACCFYGFGSSHGGKKRYSKTSNGQIEMAGGYRDDDDEIVEEDSFEDEEKIR